jgi:hypothetical protein
VTDELNSQIFYPRDQISSVLGFFFNVSNELWEDVPLATRGDMWDLHDSAPPHCACDVTH